MTDKEKVHDEVQSFLQEEYALTHEGISLISKKKKTSDEVLENGPVTTSKNATVQSGNHPDDVDVIGQKATEEFSKNKVIDKDREGVVEDGNAEATNLMSKHMPMRTELTHKNGHDSNSHEQDNYHTDDEGANTPQRVTITPDQARRMKEQREIALQKRRDNMKNRNDAINSNTKRSLQSELAKESKKTRVINPYLKTSRSSSNKGEKNGREKKKEADSSSGESINLCSSQIVLGTCSCHKAHYYQAWCPLCSEKINLGDCITKEHDQWHHTECPTVVEYKPLRSNKKSTESTTTKAIDKLTGRGLANAKSTKKAIHAHAGEKKNSISLAPGFVHPDCKETATAYV